MKTSEIILKVESTDDADLTRQDLIWYNKIQFGLPINFTGSCAGYTLMLALEWLSGQLRNFNANINTICDKDFHASYTNTAVISESAHQKYANAYDLLESMAMGSCPRDYDINVIVEDNLNYIIPELSSKLLKDLGGVTNFFSGTFTKSLSQLDPFIRHFALFLEQLTERFDAAKNIFFIIDNPIHRFGVTYLINQQCWHIHDITTQNLNYGDDEDLIRHIETGGVVNTTNCDEALFFNIHCLALKNTPSLEKIKYGFELFFENYSVSLSDCARIDSHNNNALSFSLLCSNLSLLEQIRHLGFDITAKLPDGLTASQSAMLWHRFDIIEKLIQMQVVIDYNVPEFDAFLISAVQHKITLAVQMLLNTTKLTGITNETRTELANKKNELCKAFMEVSSGRSDIDRELALSMLRRKQNSLRMIFDYKQVNTNLFQANYVEKLVKWNKKCRGKNLSIRHSSYFDHFLGK